jgi:hypothetical protein
MIALAFLTAEKAKRSQIRGWNPGLVNDFSLCSDHNTGDFPTLSTSNPQPTPNGILPCLTGTRRIENRRSFEGNDA